MVLKNIYIEMILYMLYINALEIVSSLQQYINNLENVE